ncbi:hypothetical protein A2U01_0063118, partial [Trifolium medium]|nr:hypothetical protein [Trifolium medium]
GAGASSTGAVTGVGLGAEAGVTGGAEAGGGRCNSGGCSSWNCESSGGIMPDPWTSSAKTRVTRLFLCF